MTGLLDHLTGRFLYWMVLLGLTPSHWPWGSCGTVILEVKAVVTASLAVPWSRGPSTPATATWS